jgi:hypothetical protein
MSEESYTLMTKDKENIDVKQEIKDYKLKLYTESQQLISQMKGCE